MKTLQKVVMVAGALGLSSTVFVLYKLLTSTDDDEEDEEDRRQSATSKQTIIELEVPAKAAGTIIGRQGTNIKEIQKTTGTRINFKDTNPSSSDKDGSRTVIIRGTAESAQRAENTIRELVANIPVVLSEVMFVPSSALGRIIGRNGDTIKGISRSSGAKVFIDRTKDEYRDIDREVQITGTKEQIDLGKTLIDEKLQEEKVFRAKKSVMEANRDKRTKPMGDTKSSKREELSLDKTDAGPVTPSLHLDKVCCWPPGGREFVEVYVSSVANPQTFYVQILTSASLRLDELVKSMSQYYSTPRQVDIVDTVNLGDLVAAPFDEDASWYRARVCGFQGDDPDMLDLFYLDYGDNCFLPKNKVRVLQSQFVSFPFQAVECELANVYPKDGDTWEEEVIDRFEQLTYSAQWKVLMARLSEIKTLSTGEKIHFVELVDTNGEKDVNIAKQLCEEDLARWC